MSWNSTESPIACHKGRVCELWTPPGVRWNGLWESTELDDHVSNLWNVLAHAMEDAIENFTPTTFWAGHEMFRTSTAVEGLPWHQQDVFG